MPTATANITTSDRLAERRAAELRYDRLPADVAADLANPYTVADLRGLIRNDIAALRGWRQAGKGFRRLADRIERKVAHNWLCYRLRQSVERDARSPSVATARRRVRECLGDLQAIRTGRLAGDAYRTLAASVGLLDALTVYRAAQARAQQ